MNKNQFNLIKTYYRKRGIAAKENTRYYIFKQYELNEFAFKNNFINLGDLDGNNAAVLLIKYPELKDKLINVIKNKLNFYDGFARVILNNKQNLINQEGEFLSNQWFDNIDDFDNGFAIVKLNNKWNFINQEGKEISNQWFNDVNNFENGFAKVLLKNKYGSYKYNFLNQEGELVSPNQWFDHVFEFVKGFARVGINNEEWYYLDTKGNLTKDKPVDENKLNIITK